MPIKKKILVLGGRFGFSWKGGSANFIFMGAGIFLIFGVDEVWLLTKRTVIFIVGPLRLL